MTVIAMTREMGSLGKDVAAGVAERLDLEVVHHELVERDLASRMKVEESDVHRFLEGSPSLLARWKIDKGRLSRYTAEEVLELATRGNVVIRGWGACSLLRRVPHVLRVRVCAPMAFRARVLRERLGLDDERAARREIERNDAAHTRTLAALGETNWESPLHYDLTLNTERVPVDDCVSQVEAMAIGDAFQPTAASEQVLADLVIESHVRAVIGADRTLAAAARHVDIIVGGGGEVVVSGSTESEETGRLLCGAVRNVPGVRSVTDNLFVPNLTSPVDRGRPMG